MCYHTTVKPAPKHLTPIRVGLGPPAGRWTLHLLAGRRCGRANMLIRVPNPAVRRVKRSFGDIRGADGIAQPHAAYGFA